MAFYPQSFSRASDVGGSITAVADSVCYIKNTDRANIMAAWGAHRNIAVPILDTDGKRSIVYFHNSNKSHIKLSSLTADNMIQDILRKNKTNHLYVLGRYPGQPGAYFDKANNIHVSSILQSSRDADILPRFINTGENIYEGYTPLGLFTNDQEFYNMSLIDSGVSKKTLPIEETIVVNQPQDVVGDEFTRSYDAPGIDPSMYWLSNKL